MRSPLLLLIKLLLLLLPPPMVAAVAPTSSSLHPKTTPPEIKWRASLPRASRVHAPASNHTEETRARVEAAAAAAAELPLMVEEEEEERRTGMVEVEGSTPATPATRARLNLREARKRFA